MMTEVEKKYLILPRHYLEEYASLLGKTYWQLLDEIKHNINKGGTKLMMTKDAYKVEHIKTGNEYFVIKRDVIECTNGREEKKYVIYYRDGKFFCREQEEFDQKFKEL